jgi:hypothetical protein
MSPNPSTVGGKKLKIKKSGSRTSACSCFMHAIFFHFSLGIPIKKFRGWG